MLGQRFLRTVVAVLALCYVTEAETGQNGGYFYQFWQDQPGFATYSNGPNGQYSLKWSGNGDVVAGKGWQTGSARYVARTSRMQYAQDVDFLELLLLQDNHLRC